MSERKRLFSTANITRMAMFVAIVLAFQAAPVPPFMGGFFRLAALPLILSGFILGPKAGFWVGAISDVLEFIIFPRGKIFFPGFTITQALTASVPALILGSRTPSFLNCLFAIFCGQALTKLLLVPVFLVFISSVPDFWIAWKTFAFQAAVTQSFHVPIYAWCSALVLRSFPKELQPDISDACQDCD